MKTSHEFNNIYDITTKSTMDVRLISGHMSAAAYLNTVGYMVGWKTTDIRTGYLVVATNGKKYMMSTKPTKAAMAVIKTVVKVTYQVL